MCAAFINVEPEGNSKKRNAKVWAADVRLEMLGGLGYAPEEPSNVNED